jgi:circadian clock protein KaiC
MEMLTTGVAELDLVLDGGLPTGALVVIGGGPGTGKTILGQQICFANATEERKALFYTTYSAPHAKLIRFLRPFDFFDENAVERRVQFLNLESLLRRERGDGYEPLVPAVAEVVRTTFEQRPSVIVVDGFKALRVFADEQEVWRMFYDLSGRVAHSDTVLLILGEYTTAEMEANSEFSLADVIIQLANESHDPVGQRWIRVSKRRGGNPLAGQHTLTIDRRGIVVAPRLESLTPRAAALDDTRLPTGVPGLDRLMGGGIPAGDVTALLGPSGCGKTAAALKFVVQGIEHGERCLYVSFQEDAEQLVKKAASFGWEIAAARESGQLRIHHVPDRLNLDVVGSAIHTELSSGDLRRVAIDSLAELAFAARETERFPSYARTLTGFLRAAGATSLLISETPTFGRLDEPLPGLSFLFHNVVLLRYIERGSELRRALAVLKMRDSDHDQGLWQFQIDQHGPSVGDKLHDLTGLLGWSALREDSIQGS